MQIDYAKMLKWVRVAALWFAGFIVTTVAGGFILQLCEGANWYKHPWDTVAAVIAVVHWLLASATFHWVGGIIVGLAVGIWVDDRLRWLASKTSPTPKPEPKKGLFDYKLDIEVSGRNFAEGLAAVCKYTNDAATLITKRRISISALTARSGQYSSEEFAKMTQREAARVSSDFRKYAKKMNVLNSKLRAHAKILTQSIEWFSRNSSDWVQQNDASLRDLQTSSEYASKQLHVFFDTIVGFTGYSADLNTASDLAATELNNLFNLIGSLQVACIVALTPYPSQAPGPNQAVMNALQSLQGTGSETPQ